MRCQGRTSSSKGAVGRFGGACAVWNRLRATDMNVDVSVDGPGTTRLNLLGKPGGRPPSRGERNPPFLGGERGGAAGRQERREGDLGPLLVRGDRSLPSSWGEVRERSGGGPERDVATFFGDRGSMEEGSDRWTLGTWVGRRSPPHRKDESGPSILPFDRIPRSKSSPDPPETILFANIPSVRTRSSVVPVFVRSSPHPRRGMSPLPAIDILLPFIGSLKDPYRYLPLSRHRSRPPPQAHRHHSFTFDRHTRVRQLADVRTHRSA